MGFHWYQLAILGVLALLVFGPKRLPEIGSSIGKTIKEFQKSIKEVTDGSHTEHATPEQTALPATTQTALQAEAQTAQRPIAPVVEQAQSGSLDREPSEATMV